MISKIKIDNEVFEYNVLEIGADFIKIDDKVLMGLSEECWKNIECDVDVQEKRRKAIMDLEKSENIPEKVDELQRDNIRLTEENRQFKEDYINLALAVTEVYEMSL